MSLFNNENIIIINKATGSWVKGHHVDGDISYVRGKANVQPINDDELQSLKEGERIKGTLKFYSETEILKNYFVRRADVIKANENIAKVVICTIDNIVDSTDYTCTINDTEFLYNSGIGATALSIVDGIVTNILLGSELISVIDNFNGTYTITSSIEGTDFTISVDDNQSFSIDTVNIKKEYKIMQSKDYIAHNIKYYKAYGYLVERKNGL